LSTLVQRENEKGRKRPPSRFGKKRPERENAMDHHPLFKFGKMTQVKRKSARTLSGSTEKGGKDRTFRGGPGRGNNRGSIGQEESRGRGLKC